MDTVISACLDELEKISSTFGKNLGKTYGRTSAKAGWSTGFRSAGVQTTKPPRVPQLPGTKRIKGVGGLTPKSRGEVNNTVELRRGLSNIETH
jgi:hypothetical protein